MPQSAGCEQLRVHLLLTSQATCLRQALVHGQGSGMAQGGGVAILQDGGTVPLPCGSGL